MNCSLYRCAYDVHNYDAQQHRDGQIIPPLTFQTITIAPMLCVGGEGEHVDPLHHIVSYRNIRASNKFTLIIQGPIGSNGRIRVTRVMHGSL